VPNQQDPDVTRLDPSSAVTSAAPTPAPGSPAPGSRPPTSSGSVSTGGRRLTTSDALDHGRFAPGVMVAERYRMIGRLGSGGMGEVYRADDLKLGQPVALKFLPEAVDKDPARLTQLHSEVRIARQISHPNVCRVYDIDEFEGSTFLSMEYVDGEDLASLLRRVGRLAPDRAIALARQICAGLSAAHDREIVHRDLKPANIMLDGQGDIRITDFGLAGAAGLMPRVGTPAYMAPEQLAGEPVTPRSDLYALGLVLYEMFTGMRALNAKNLAELIAKREQVDITPPTTIVRDLDPAIERIILRCLERDPARRPTSALAVAAALPGGDPLAAALAAGVTLSPEIVSAAGVETAWPIVRAFATLSFALLGLVSVLAIGDRVLLTGYVPIDGPAAVMADRAEQIRQRLGYREPYGDRASGYLIASDYLRYVDREPASERAASLSRGRPSALQFWYRTSPRPLAGTGFDFGASLDDPPLTVSGMTTLVVDGKGRLVAFDAVPPQQDTDTSKPSEPDWNALFQAADLPRDRFAPVTPQWTPQTYADTRAAWSGPLPESPDIRVRLEAAAYRGRITSIAIVGPWSQPTRMEQTGRPGSRRWAASGGTFFGLTLLIGAFFIARVNVRKGRGDRRGATLVATFVFGAELFVAMSESAHELIHNFTVTEVFNRMGTPLTLATLVWGLYLAVEPFIRRYWPDTLVSWTRLLSGRLRDPRVGRDVLLGCAFGVAMLLINLGHNLLPALVGQPPLPPDRVNPAYLEGGIHTLALIARFSVLTLLEGMAFTFGVVFIRAVVRRVWLAALIAIAVFSMNTVAQAGLSNSLDILASLAAVCLIVFAIVRLGVLVTLIGFFIMFLLAQAPLTADVGKWFASTSSLLVLLCAALAICGFVWSRAGEPLFGKTLLD
jgi:hypothetical protein